MCSLCIVQIRMRQKRKMGFNDFKPYFCLTEITSGFVEGSAKNLVSSYDEKWRASTTILRSSGWGWRRVRPLAVAMTSLGLRAGHSPLRRWTTSPRAAEQPGRLQASDSPVHFDVTALQRYVPTKILAWTVAEGVAVDEYLLVVQIWWGAFPSGESGVASAWDWTSEKPYGKVQSARRTQLLFKSVT